LCIVAGRYRQLDEITEGGESRCVVKRGTGVDMQGVAALKAAAVGAAAIVGVDKVSSLGSSGPERRNWSTWYCTVMN
jgi:hypothetical protein